MHGNLGKWWCCLRAQTCSTRTHSPIFVLQAYEARRAARDAEREAQEAAQEEEIRWAAEERRRREEEEAAKWMHMFTVEAAGEEALSQEEGQVLPCCFCLCNGSQQASWQGQPSIHWQVLPSPRR